MEGTPSRTPTLARCGAGVVNNYVGQETPASSFVDGDSSLRTHIVLTSKAYPHVVRRGPALLVWKVTRFPTERAGELTWNRDC
jgi:hypothetical protein